MRDHRDRRIAQDVYPDDATLGHPLGARGTHIVLVHFIQHKGAEQAQVRRQSHRQRDQDRQRGIAEQVFDKAVAPTLHRKHAQLVGEEILKHDDVDQDTDRHRDSTRHHHHAVGQRAAHEGDTQCQRNGKESFQDRQRNQHRQRRAEARQDHIRHRFTRTPAGAEVEGQDLLDEDPQLDVIRLIDAKLLADVRDLFRVRHLAGQDVGRIAADPVEQHEYQHDHAQHGRRHLP